MTWEVDGYSDPCTQSVPRPTHHHRGRPPLVGLEMQSDVNTEMKSWVSCFLSLLNFNMMSRRTSNNIADREVFRQNLIQEDRYLKGTVVTLSQTTTKINKKVVTLFLWLFIFNGIFLFINGECH